jgi:hypothetical protein
MFIVLFVVAGIEGALLIPEVSRAWGRAVRRAAQGIVSEIDQHRRAYTEDQAWREADSSCSAFSLPHHSKWPLCESCQCRRYDSFSLPDSRSAGPYAKVKS